MTEKAQAGIGHNQPDARAALIDQVDHLVEIVNQWHKEVPEIKDEDQAEKAADLSARIKAQLKDVENARKEEKKPLLEAQREIDAAFKGIASKLDASKGAISPLITAWLKKQDEIRREEERKAAEKAEAARLAAEETQRALDEAQTSHGDNIVGSTLEAEAATKAAQEAEKDAARKAKERASVKGKYSERATGLRTTYYANVVNHTMACTYFMDHPKMVDLVQELANAWARSPEARKKPVPGVELVTEQTAA